MDTVYISMLVFAFIGAITPGPVNIIATSAGANLGFVQALRYVAGASIAYASVVFVSGIGLNTVLLTNPEMAVGLRYLGAIFLLYMAFKIAAAKPTEANTGFIAKPPSFIEGLLIQSLNPKAWLVAMSGVSLFVIPYQPMLRQLIIFSLISLLICFLSVGCWALLGQFIRKFLANEQRQALFNIVMGLLLAGTVITLFIEA